MNAQRMLASLSFLLLGGVAGAAAATCQPGSTTVKAAMSTNASTMDSILSTTTATRQIAIHAFESLVTYDENYKVIPQLADSWQVSPDGLTYTFRLRADVKFHNGAVMTADDVKASMDRYLRVSPGAGRFKNVKSIEVVDPSTLRITLAKDFPLLANLAMPVPMIAVYPKEIVDKYGDKEIRGSDVIGTGPYRIVEWKPDVAVRLARFDDYRPDPRFDGPTGFGGKRTACAAQVEFIPATEESSRVAGLQTGAYDYAEAVPITSVEQLERDKNIKVEIVKPKWGVLLELNPGEGIMGNRQFRRALVAALNSQQIMQAASFGNRQEYFRVQPSIFFPEQKDWYSTAGSEIYNRQDLELVKKLLAEAGYKGEPIVYLTNQNYAWMYKASQAVAAQWKKAGINVQLELMDWPSQIQKAQSLKGWAVNQTGWSPRFDPIQTISSLQCGSPAAYNYCNKTMDAALDRVNSGAAAEERKKAWDEAQKLVWDDVAIIRLGDYFEPEATRTSLSGYKPFYVTPRFWDVAKPNS